MKMTTEINMEMSKEDKAASNTIIVWDKKSEKIIKTFSAEVGENNKITPAAVQLRKFREEVGADPDHTYYQAMRNGDFWFLNGHPEQIKARMALVFN